MHYEVMHLIVGSVNLKAAILFNPITHILCLFTVHFRIRVIDQHRPKSLSPSTSGITYWQVEAEHSILDGKVHYYIYNTINPD